MKWRQSADGAGKLVLKITDNTTVSMVVLLLCVRVSEPGGQCLKFKTHSSVFLNRFDALNLTLMQKMQNRRPAQASTTLTPSASIASQIPTSASSQTAASEAPSTPAPGGPAGGGVKKKKPKKKK